MYGLQKDECTKSWSDKAKKLDIKDIRLCGNPEKDKVDNKIKKRCKPRNKKIINRSMWFALRHLTKVIRILLKN